jgi:hypothetical protein
VGGVLSIGIVSVSVILQRSRGFFESATDKPTFFISSHNIHCAHFIISCLISQFSNLAIPPEED